MAISIISGILGFAIFLMAILAAILNLSVLYVLVKGGFLKSNKSSIYIFAFSNISGYLLQSIAGVYLGASSFAQNWLFPDGQDNFFVLAISLIFLGQWFQEMFMQAIVALDRLVIVVMPRFAWIFSRNVVIVISIIILPIGMTLAYFANFVAPCCRETIYYGVYTNTYISDGAQFNYVNTYINLPVNVITSGTALTCYLIIYIYIAKVDRKVASNVSNTMNSQRKKKEVRYALQFAAMSCFILFSWLCFLIIPLVVPINRPDLLPLFSSAAFLFFLHICVNSFILITINSEFKKQFRTCMFSKASNRIFTLVGINKPPMNMNLEIMAT